MQYLSPSPLSRHASLPAVACPAQAAAEGECASRHENDSRHPPDAASRRAFPREPGDDPPNDPLADVCPGSCRRPQTASTWSPARPRSTTRCARRADRLRQDSRCAHPLSTRSGACVRESVERTERAVTVECVRCGQVFTDAQAFADHDPKCKCRPLVSSPDEWRWRTERAQRPSNVQPRHGS